MGLMISTMNFLFGNDKKMEILQKLDKSVDSIQKMLQKMDEREKHFQEKSDKNVDLIQKMLKQMDEREKYRQEKREYISDLKAFSEQINTFLTWNDPSSTLQTSDQIDTSNSNQSNTKNVEAWDLFNRIYILTDNLLQKISQTFQSDPFVEQLKRIELDIRKIKQKGDEAKFRTVLPTNMTPSERKQYTTIQVDFINSIKSATKEINDIIQAPELL